MNNLRKFFPIIRTKDEVLKEINQSASMTAIYYSWSPEQQQQFLDICTGVRGMKITYDPIFKEAFNPEYAPERLEHLLSQIIGKKVRILCVLPNDSTRLTDESSLLVTDIVVEFEDHSIANIEIQKIGYHFPGQRCACYSADLLLRQYRRLRSEKKKKFSYIDVKDVYTIIFFEKSTKEFHAYPDCYLHTFTQVSNSGLKLDFLQKYYLIPLDIFHESLQNNGIRNELDAWLTFLTSDEPEMIASLVDKFPQFKVMYQELYEICLNMERMMEMFSKELLELDRNTVQYMIDIMQDDIDMQKKQLEQNRNQLAQQENQLAQQENQLAQQKNQLAQQKNQLAQQKNQLAQKDAQISQLELNNQLTTLLIQDNRIQDLQRMVADSEYRDILIKEYKLDMQ